MLIKSNSPRSNPHTHAAEFDTLRFNQHIPGKRFYFKRILFTARSMELTMTILIHKPEDKETFVKEFSEGVAELVWRDSTKRSDNSKKDTELRRNTIEHRNLQS